MYNVFATITFVIDRDDVIVECESSEQLLMPSLIHCSLYNASCYVTSPARQPPSSSVNFDLPLVPAAQSHYSLPLPVGPRDVIAERGIEQQEPERDLGTPTSLTLTAGSRSPGDACKENASLHRRRVTAEPTHCFKTARKHRGLTKHRYTPCLSSV